jgi:SpoVK/Ycf46/Vps4 family AAA+-type ATPase
MKPDHLFHLCRVIDGAVKADHEKVVAYSEKLAQLLEKDGEHEAAKRIRQLLKNGKVSKMVLARSVPQSPPAALPVDGESRLPVADEEYLERGSVTIILPPDTRRTVERFLDYMRAADALVASGVSVSPTMLMYGPPGTGKTLLARYIASELSLPLIISRMDGLISSYLGSTAKNLRQLFDHAASRPCVLFLDEFDALAKMRDDGRELGELKRVVISLLQNIDALQREHVLLAATNHEHLLDRAIWRRFAYTVKLDLPDEKARTELFRMFLGRFGNDSLLKPVSILSEGFSGAQIKDICEGAIREAVLTGQSTVQSPDLVRALIHAIEGQAGATDINETLRSIRAKNPRVFSERKLAELFGMSQPQVHRRLKEGA